jgi:WD40 repeat protein
MNLSYALRGWLLLPCLFLHIAVAKAGEDARRPPRLVQRWVRKDVIVVAQASFHASGNVLVGILPNGTIKVWDARDGAEHVSYAAKCDLYRPAVLDPKKMRLVAALNDRTLKMWDLEAKREQWSITPYTGSLCQSLAFSPDGKTIVTAGEDRTTGSNIKGWEPDTGRLLWSLPASHWQFTSLAFSPDGRRLAYAGRSRPEDDFDIVIVDLIARKEGRVMKGVDKETLGIQWSWFSDDGKRLITGEDDPQCIRVWDLETGKCKSTIPLVGKEGILSLSYSAKADLLAGAFGTVKQYVRAFEGLREGKPGKLFEIKDISALVALSPDGKLLAKGKGGEFGIWELRFDDAPSCAKTRDRGETVE